MSRVCGSSIEVDIGVDNGVISAYGHKISACALGQTSAAVMGREIVGSTAAELSYCRRLSAIGEATALLLWLRRLAVSRGKHEA